MTDEEFEDFATVAAAYGMKTRAFISLSGQLRPS